MKILSINGGGAKGMRVASFLNSQTKGLEFADMYAGTSTGSIICAMLAVGHSTNKIKKTYETLGQEVFKKSFLRMGLLREKYDNRNLIQLAHETYGDIRFGDLNTDLFIPVLNITHKKVDFIRTTSEKYKKVLVMDAVIASSSAPSFFKPYYFGGCIYIDGGVAINNPCFASYTEAKKKTGQIHHSLTSLTTGSDVIEDYEAMRSWTVSDAPDLINVILNEQERSSHYYASQWISDYQRIEMLSNLSSGKIDYFSNSNTRNMILEGQNTAKQLK